MNGSVMFLDCPAYMDAHGAVRCGLPAAVEGHLGHQAERLERREELLSPEAVGVRLGVPDGHHVQAALIRAGQPGDQAVGVLGRVVLGASSSTRTTRASSRSRPKNDKAAVPSSGPAITTA